MIATQPKHAAPGGSRREPHAKTQGMFFASSARTRFVRDALTTEPRVDAIVRPTSLNRLHFSNIFFFLCFSQRSKNTGYRRVQDTSTWQMTKDGYHNNLFCGPKTHKRFVGARGDIAVGETNRQLSVPVTQANRQATRDASAVCKRGDQCARPGCASAGRSMPAHTLSAESSPLKHGPSGLLSGGHGSSGARLLSATVRVGSLQGSRHRVRQVR